MNKSFWFSLKILSILTLFMGFCFVIIEQRLEAKTFDIKIKTLTSDMETISVQKRDLNRQIDSETARLASLKYNGVISPISINDVISVEVKNTPETPVSTGNDSKESDFFGILAAFFTSGKSL